MPEEVCGDPIRYLRGVAEVVDDIRKNYLGTENRKSIPTSPEAVWQAAKVLMRERLGSEYLIRMRSVKFAQYRRGLLLARTDSADIYYDSSLNECHRRFVQANELIHLVADDNLRDARPEYDRADISDARLNRIFRMSAEKITEEALNSAEFAYFGATELLIPLEHRKVFDSEKSDFALANDFKVPEITIARMRMGGYLEASRSVRA